MPPYLDEQTFRFNNRKGLSDGDRLNLAVMGIAGKRLTWKRLIGEEESGRELN